ncbi:hypothetical protein [Snodgrassella sp. CFCC 13594]|uniref:hypothetical protein n=1 Tax=Snodgrassella sp. CFCC 13594 TaxID=1775559 RepID=UPI0008344AA5|nr:hypothetical protein [Snodgrassella sp. CFCC 13594]
MNNSTGETPQFVFTLSDDVPTTTSNKSTTSATTLPLRSANQKASNLAALETDDEADWERSLERLRQHKQQEAVPSLPIDDIFAHHESAAPLVQEPQPARAAPLSPHQPDKPITRADASIGISTSEEVILDPIQRERVYRAYLQEWQHKTTLEQEKTQSALNDDAVLFQEDWLAAQNCLTRADADAPEACTVRLSRHNQAEVVTSMQSDSMVPAEAEMDDGDFRQPEASIEQGITTPEAPAQITHVHLHVIEPQGAQGRSVRCVSEAALLAQIAEKLRPHLADAMAGMMRVAIQKHMAHVIANIQKQLLADIPNVVDEVLDHNLERALQQVKKTARR